MITILVDGCKTPTDVVHLLRDQYYDVKGPIFIRRKFEGRFEAGVVGQGPNHEIRLTDNDLVTARESAWKPSDTPRVHA